jgi:hypothetical protein
VLLSSDTDDVGHLRLQTITFRLALLAIPALASGCFGMSKSAGARLSAYALDGDAIEGDPASRFEQARQVLRDHCAACHTQISGTLESEILASGWIVPGNASASLLIQRSRHSGFAAANMPPASGAAFTPTHLETLRSWINGLSSASPSPTPIACTPGQDPAPTPLKRLSRQEYLNSVTSVLSFMMRLESSPGVDAQGCAYQRLGLRVFPEFERFPTDQDPRFPSLDARLSQYHIDAAFAVARTIAHEFTAPQIQVCGTSAGSHSSCGQNPDGSYINCPVLVRETVQTIFGACAWTSNASNTTTATGVMSTSPTCASQFLQPFLRFVFKRPPTSTELNRYLAIFQSSPGAEGYRKVITVALSSPQFLYHLETEGALVAGRNDLMDLSPYELASRLSFHFWKSTPDEHLLNAAASGALSSSQGIRETIQGFLNPQDDLRSRRSLAWPILDEQRFQIRYRYPSPLARTQETFRSFWLPWLKKDDIPLYNPALNYAFETMSQYYGARRGGLLVRRGTNGALIADQIPQDLQRMMRNELEDLGSHIMWERAGGFDELLNHRAQVTTYAGIGNLYGVPERTPGTPVSSELPAQERSGILTRASYLWAGSTSTSPFHRGALIRKQMLCDSIQDPTEVGINPTQIQHPQFNATLTTRARHAAITQDASCLGCHRKIDAFGFVLEAYDSMGQHRNMGQPGRELYFARSEAEQNQAGSAVIGNPLLDLTASIEIEPGQNVTLSSPQQLMQELANSSKAQSCFARNLIRFSRGREADPATDACLIQQTRDLVRTPSGGLKDAWTELPMHPQFQRRKIAP